MLGSDPKLSGFRVPMEQWEVSVPVAPPTQHCSRSPPSARDTDKPIKTQTPVSYPAAPCAQLGAWNLQGSSN